MKPLLKKFKAGKNQIVRVLVALKVWLLARLLVVFSHLVPRLATPPIWLPVFITVAPLWRLLRLVFKLKLFSHVVQK